MSARKKPIHIQRSATRNRDLTIQFFNLNILSHNQGPGFAVLLKIAALTAFAYMVSRFVSGEPLCKKLR